MSLVSSPRVGLREFFQGVLSLDVLSLSRSDSSHHLPGLGPFSEPLGSGNSFSATQSCSPILRPDRDGGFERPSRKVDKVETRPVELSVYLSVTDV